MVTITVVACISVMVTGSETMLVAKSKVTFNPNSKVKSLSIVLMPEWLVLYLRRMA